MTPEYRNAMKQAAKANYLAGVPRDVLAFCWLRNNWPIIFLWIAVFLAGVATQCIFEIATGD